MTRPNILVIVAIIALLIAGAASILANNYLKSHSGVQNRGLPILTAAKDIPVGTRLAAEDLRLTAWPKEALVQGYLTDPKKLQGRVAVRAMSAGDIVTDSKLLPEFSAGTSGIMTYMVPQGHRAVTVAVNEVAGVAGFITPGSKVDVVLTTTRPGAAAKEEQISKIILQNVPVLASGQGTEQKEGKPVVVPTVTLDLAPEDAEKLIVGAGGNTASNRGTLQLLLRNVVDMAAVDTKGATVFKALGSLEPRVERQHKAPQLKVVRATPAAPPVQAKVTVEVIQGSVKSTRQFLADNNQ